jgi:hypothetical protein
MMKFYKMSRPWNHPTYGTNPNSDKPTPPLTPTNNMGYVMECYEPVVYDSLKTNAIIPLIHKGMIQSRYLWSEKGDMAILYVIHLSRYL